MARDRGAGWAKLRDLGPVVHGDGWYYLTRRDDVLAALRDPEVFSSRIGLRRHDQPGSAGTARCSIRRSTPAIAGSCIRSSARRHSDAVLPSLQAQAIDIIDADRQRDECEVMADLATPYPSQVFLTLFGLPLEDRERLIAWKDAIIALSLDHEPDTST